jgi:hypothetical protein
MPVNMPSHGRDDHMDTLRHPFVSKGDTGQITQPDSASMVTGQVIDPTYQATSTLHPTVECNNGRERRCCPF